jgi:hypothetical protein
MTSMLATSAVRLTTWRLGGRARKVVLLILSTLVVTSLRGEVAKAADLGTQLAAGADLDWNLSNMLYPPIVSPTALTVAFLLAVFKPWGRIRRSARQGSKS